MTPLEKSRAVWKALAERESQSGREKLSAHLSIFLLPGNHNKTERRLINKNARI